MAYRSAFFGAVMALLATAALAAPENPMSVHQEADFSAPPARIYAALLDEKQFSGFTGAPAKIDRNEGGAFSLFGGAIVGRNIELNQGKRVVQAWRDSGWAPGVYSMVRFELTPRGKGTHLVLDQTGFPDGEFKPLTEGWPAHYWMPMKKFFR
jgi:activator of HSP90 ATPase